MFFGGLRWQLTVRPSVGHVRSLSKPLRDARTRSFPSSERQREGASVLIFLLLPRPRPARPGKRGRGKGPFGGLFALFIRILRRGGGRTRGERGSGGREGTHHDHSHSTDLEQVGPPASLYNIYNRIHLQKRTARDRTSIISNSDGPKIQMTVNPPLPPNRILASCSPAL